MLAGGPFDVEKTKLKKGDVLDKIDGAAITADEDWAKLLNHKADKFVLVNFHDRVTARNTTKPLSQ